MTEYINMAGYVSQKIMFPITTEYMNMAGYVSQNHANMTKKIMFPVMMRYMNMTGYVIPHHDRVNEYGGLCESKSCKYDQKIMFPVMMEYMNMAGYVIHEYGRLCESKKCKYDQKIMFPIMTEYINIAGYVSQKIMFPITTEYINMAGYVSQKIMFPIVEQPMRVTTDIGNTPKSLSKREWARAEWKLVGTGGIIAGLTKQIVGRRAGGEVSVGLVRRWERRRTDIRYISKAVVEKAVGRNRPVGLWHWAVEVGRKARQWHTVVRSSYHFRGGTKYMNMAGYVIHEYGRLCESKSCKYDQKIIFPITTEYMNMAGYVSQNHADMTKKSCSPS
ncbi:hypothetical protein BY996DRAFT_6546955 [Phakopsora pachyrhizi]|nr:hypothetical protein BY996DRAFT_6546955 [Phakopsora pachyrhizi]